MNITDEELRAILGVQSIDEWDAVVAEIRQRRGGEYPRDWYKQVKESGIMKLVFKRWGGTPQLSFGFEGK